MQVFLMSEALRCSCMFMSCALSSSSSLILTQNICPHKYFVLYSILIIHGYFSWICYVSHYYSNVWSSFIFLVQSLIYLPSLSTCQSAWATTCTHTHSTRQCGLTVAPSCSPLTRIRSHNCSSQTPLDCASWVGCIGLKVPSTGEKYCETAEDCSLCAVCVGC